jgi:hypothetical protein
VQRSLVTSVDAILTQAGFLPPKVRVRATRLAISLAAADP